VDNLEEEIKRLKEKGFPIVDTGAYGKIGEEMGARMAFIHPRATHGVLVEVFGIGVLIMGDSGVGKSVTLKHILDSVYGVDIHPLAGLFIPLAEGSA
jgi:Cdc6-like AAA superfamily ATPase